MLCATFQNIIPYFIPYFEKYEKLLPKHIPHEFFQKTRRWRSGLERSSRKRKVWCSNPSRDRLKVVKPVVTTPLLNARHEVCHGSSEMIIINEYPV